MQPCTYEITLAIVKPDSDPEKVISIHDKYLKDR